MSNCVELKNNVVTLQRGEIDVEGFKTLIDSVKDSRDAPAYELDEGISRTTWWFLATNTEFYHDRIVIRFGEGRSIHTWRDLRGTLHVLSKFIRRPRAHVFRAADEDRGYSSWGRYAVNLQTGEEM